MFIYRGDVIQRFQAGRTDFFQYNEAMSEFPTIVMEVLSPPANQSIGKDFNITLNINLTATILTVGKNHIKGSQLYVDFQHISQQNGNVVMHSKITPLNLAILNSWWYVFYSFRNTSQYSESKVTITLSTENNTNFCNGENDGEVHTVFTNIGEAQRILVQPQKFLYLQDEKTPCREKPFVDELLTLMHEDMLRNPGRQCRFPAMFDTCPAVAKIENINELPACVNGTGSQYMFKLFKSVPRKPCTKVSYQTKTTGPYPTGQNMATFFVFLGYPYEIIVNEEYYLYDLISVISAIGGTMGLCIGFSFKDFAKDLMSYLTQGWEKVTQLMKTKQSVPQTHHNRSKQQTI